MPRHASHRARALLGELRTFLLVTVAPGAPVLALGLILKAFEG